MHAGKIEKNLEANSKHIMGTDNNIKNVNAVKEGIQSSNTKDTGIRIDGKPGKDVRTNREMGRKAENKNKAYKKVLSNYSTVYLSIGSNIGDKEKNLKKAVGAINRHPDINIISVSSIYKTDPMYVKNQDYFYNIVLSAEIKKTFSPFVLLGFLKEVEYEMGRKKAQARYGPRTIDIDILYYNDICIDSNFLTIPHPKLAERNFVLVPLSEIAPDFMIGGKNVKEFIEESNFAEKVEMVRSW